MTCKRFDPAAFLARYDALDAALVKAGFPASSPWWRAQIERFVRSGCRRWVIRAGRRAGKSSTLCRLAVAWALWGSWFVPPGDTAIIPFVSVDRGEAAARLKTIGEILRALRLKPEARADELELTDRRLVFRVVTCSIRGTVGFTAVAVFGDEMARWESRDTAANPAQEVMGSLRPTMATQPDAFEVCSSSPWGEDDYHAELFDSGDSAHQLTSFAETWTANPTITEDQTHELEPDERVWSREYAAQPGTTLSAAIDAADVARCYDSKRVGAVIGGFVAIDASSLRGDAFAYIAGQRTDADEFIVSDVGGFEGAALKSVSMETVVRTIAERARAWRTDAIFGDQREEAALRALFAQHDVALQSFAWSESSKDAAMQWLRRAMREGGIIIEHPHATLKRELLGMKARLMPSGRIKYETNGLDFASCLVTLAHACVAGAATSQSGEVFFAPTVELDHFGEPAELPGRIIQKLPGGKYRLNPTCRGPGRNGPFGGQSV